MNDRRLRFWYWQAVASAKFRAGDDYGGWVALLRAEWDW